MFRCDVWIVKIRRKRGIHYAVRWIDPTTGRMRSESTGLDRTLSKEVARRKRDELRRGIVNDPINVSWDEFASVEMEQALAKHSEAYVKMIRCTLDQFKAICNPRGPLVVDYGMIQDFIRHRLRGSRICSCRQCNFANTVDRMTCWKCGTDLPDRVRAVTPTTVNRNIRVLRALFNDAKKRYRLPSNPFDEVSALEAQEKPMRTLKPDEQRKVLDACPDLRWRTFCYLALTTGMRRQELCDLRWDAIDLDARRLVLTKTKSKKCHVVRLTTQAVEFLRKLRLTHAYPIVFVADRGGDLYWAVGRMMDQITKAADVPRFTCQDQRKSFATGLARAGVNQKVTSELIGHSDMKVTAKYYQSVDDEMADDAIGRLPLVQNQVG